MELNEIYAKSESHGGATLYEHSVSCALKCLELSSDAIKEGTLDRDVIIDMCVLSGMFHDIGKVSDDFQRRLRLEQVDIVCVHNVASIKFLTKYVNVRNNDMNIVDAVYGAMANHHPIDKKKSNTINCVEYNAEETRTLIEKLVSEYNKIRPNSSISISVKDVIGDSRSYTDYYRASDNMYNVYMFIVGNILKYADIITSSADNTIEQIHTIFDNINIINRKPQYYDNRFETQYDYANKLSKYSISCFDSQTGFGKTMLGLMFILINKKRGYWICPRNTIAQSVYKSVVEEISALGLSDTVSVALLLSNTYEFGNNKADIIVTNIDNYCRPQFKTDANIRAFDIMDSTCVFDEFHEFLTSDGILASFDVAMRARKKCTNSHTLMLSATPIKHLYFEYIDCPEAYIKFSCENILSRKKHLIFGDSKLPAKLIGLNYYICTNSVSKCQEIYTSGVSDNVIHARFTEDDRKSKTSLLYKFHGKSAYKEDIADGSTWSGNRVISTGCDVSFNNTVFYNVIPELFVQGLGRNDRWGLLEKEGVIPEVYMIYNKKGDRNEKAAVSNFYDGKLSEKFYDFMKSTFGEDSIVTLKEIYDARDKFYEDLETSRAFSAYFGKVLEESFRNLSLMNYSYSASKFDDNQSGAIHISNKPSLRGGSSDYAMWIRTYENNVPTMDGVMQSDDNMICLSDIFGDGKFLRNITSVIESNNLTNAYFGNKRKMDALFKNGIKAMEVMKILALSSDTPMIISNLYAYDKNVGLYKRK